MNDIYDYAIIGDCRSAALVSRGGSIDWLCWPHFDSPSVFGSILDESAGRWTIAPSTPFETERFYETDTNVLHTRFTTTSGVLRVTDLMPVASEAHKSVHLMPEHEVLRILECEQGSVDVAMVFEPRPDYARSKAKLRDGGTLGLRVEIPSGLLTLRTDFPLTLNAEGAHACVRLRRGDTRHASLTFTQEWLAVLPPLGAWSRQSLERSVSWWREWTSHMTYEGPWRDAIARSALTLKLLVFAPSGAVVAAPTTSLPERIGGELNWDYRFCWLRDASLTVRALFGLGYAPEAEAFLGWLLHSTRLTRPSLKVLYDVFGKLPRPERSLHHLSGYRGSRPVRVGNGAAAQLQLDIYGEVIDATTLFVRQGGRLDRETQRMLCGFGEYVCANWSRPDEGIWEPRTQRERHTHSHVLCWVALDRLIELHEKEHLRAQRIDDFVQTRALIRKEVEENAWNPTLQSYTATLGGDHVDAALLLLPWYEFSDAAAERMRSTYECIRRQLGAGDDLLYRYRLPVSRAEGAFGICSFWGAEFLALAGKIDDCRAAVEQLLAYRNDVGLFAEEIDPESRAGLGNFPQAFTHVGLVNAALTLQRSVEARAPLPRQVARPEPGDQEPQI
jgi:GH15 family glucan-1,4-alpha-glucosidase